MLNLIFIIVLFNFLGFVFGRWTHVYLNVWLGNPAWALHHWIFGLIVVLAGSIFFKETYIIMFGIGYFMSDLRDFLYLRFVGRDDDSRKKFWHID